MPPRAEKNIEIRKKVELIDLEGVGPAKVKKLNDAGIFTVEDLAVQTSENLRGLLSCDADQATDYILTALRLLKEEGMLQKEYMTGLEELERRENIQFCTTGSVLLDEMFMGGIESEAMTELFGEFGSGKTQLSLTLAINATLPKEQKGFGGGVLWIDTEGTFAADRVKGMCIARGLDWKKVLSSMTIAKSHNASHLELLIKNIPVIVREKGIKLVVIDSLTAQHRAEYTGRGTLADRQQRLNEMIHNTLRIMETYKIAVIVTNQVQSSPDTYYGDPTKPVGGNIVGHASTYRVALRKSGKNRVAKIIDSPRHAYSEAIFTVTDKGVVDDEDELKKFLKAKEKLKEQSLEESLEQIEKAE